MINKLKIIYIDYIFQIKKMYNKNQKLD
jgi:hypothetical protein